MAICCNEGYLTVRIRWTFAKDKKHIVRHCLDLTKIIQYIMIIKSIYCYDLILQYAGTKPRTD